MRNTSTRAPFPDEALAPIRKIAEGRGDSLNDLMVRGRVAFVTGDVKQAGRLFLALYDRCPKNDHGLRGSAIDYLKRIAFAIEMRPALSREMHKWQEAGGRPAPDSPIEKMRKLAAE